MLDDFVPVDHVCRVIDVHESQGKYFLLVAWTSEIRGLTVMPWTSFSYSR
jgi:hypothetical protein